MSDTDSGSDLPQREALIVKAMEGSLTPAEASQLQAWAGEDPALAELLQEENASASAATALQERVDADRALHPDLHEGPVRRMRQVGAAWVLTGTVGLVMGAWGWPLTLFGWTAVLVGSGMVMVPSVWARMKNRDPYDTIEQ